MVTSTRAGAVIALLLGAAAIGWAPIFVRLSEIGPTATAFQRTFLALPFLLAWMMWSRRDAPPLSPRARRGLFLGGLFFTGDLVVWHVSILFTTVANATLLTNLAPIFVTIGGLVLFGARVSRRFVFALILALAGAVMLSGGSLALSAEHVQGDGLAVITAMFYAGYLLSIGRLRESLDTATIMFWTTLVTTGGLLLVTVSVGEPLWPETLNGWGVVLALAVVAQVVGQGLIAYALAHLPTAYSSVSLLVQPVVAGLLAWVLFAEHLGPLQLFGGIVILSGIYLAKRS